MTRTFNVRGVFAALFLSVALAAPALALAQQTGHGGSNRGGSGGHGGQMRTRQTTRRTFTRTTQTRTSAARMSGGGRAGFGVRAQSMSGGFRSGFNVRGQSINGGFRNNSYSRPQAMAGRRQSEGSWRGSHPNWNGNYYYHNGGYYFDAGFGYPAIMSNEWSSIALIGGGIALAGALSNDPTLFFAGSVGAFYGMDQFYADQGGYGANRLRYNYFNRPYFWRNGTRFDRISVNVGGHAGYEFRRH